MTADPDMTTVMLVDDHSGCEPDCKNCSQARVNLTWSDRLQTV